MKVFINPVLIVAAVIYFSPLKAQHNDILSIKNEDTIIHKSITFPSTKTTISYRSFVVPAFMIAYGFTTLKSDALTDINEDVKKEMWNEYPHKQIHIDNYLQWSPAVAVYALNMAGIKGKNNLRDRSMIYLLSNLFLNAGTSSIKKLTKQERPDASAYNSFPSGHTAEAFASAEFLRQEYKDISPWYGVAGYAAASATGLLRMYNNKHWLSDVVAGAGIGIASTRLAYWIYPAIRKRFFKSRQMNTMMMPYYQAGSGGVSLVHSFR